MSTTTPTETPAATADEIVKEFTISTTTIGLNHSSMLGAVDALNQAGWQIHVEELSAPELAAGGAADGQFQFSTGASNTVLLVNQESDGNLKMVIDRVGNEWNLYSTTEIEECADLDGKRVAIHSEGAVSTAMVRSWVNLTCPGIEPNYFAISGSPNRLAAMIAGQVDATPLELVDGLALEREPGSYRMLVSFFESLPDFHPTTMYVNGQWGEEHPDAVQALMKAMLEENRKINEDPSGGYLKSLVEKHLSQTVDMEGIDEAIQKYIELGLFPVDGGLTQAGLEYTIKFFEDGGVIQPGLTVDDVADLSYLEAALAELGS